MYNKNNGFTLAEVGFSVGCSDSETRDIRSSAASDRISERNLKRVQEQNSRIIRYNRAFTLAEVLITLGIIGVVAAMTIPTLIANTNSQKYRSQFKKTISTLSQAARMSQAQYGFDYAGISQRCGANAANENPETTQSICALINGTLKGTTYFNKVTDIKVKNDSKYSATLPYTAIVDSVKDISNMHAYLLADGSIFMFSKELGKLPCSLPIGTQLQDSYTNVGLDGCLGFIDVNGASLPNKEVTCSSGENKIASNNCIVKNDAKHMTDIYPIRIHDGIVEPATAAARYVLKTAK